MWWLPTTFPVKELRSSWAVIEGSKFSPRSKLECVLKNYRCSRGYMPACHQVIEFASRQRAKSRWLWKLEFRFWAWRDRLAGEVASIDVSHHRYQVDDEAKTLPSLSASLASPPVGTWRNSSEVTISRMILISFDVICCGSFSDKIVCHPDRKGVLVSTGDISCVRGRSFEE